MSVDVPPDQSNIEPMPAEVKSDPLYKRVISSNKFLPGMGIFIAAVILTAFAYWFSMSSYRYDSGSPEKPQINNSNPQISATPMPSNQNTDSEFKILSIDTKYKTKPFGEFYFQVKPSNFGSGADIHSYKFGVGDCSNDVSNCDSNSYGDYIYINEVGDLYFIPTENKTYQIPIWVLYKNYLSKSVLSVEVSSAFADSEVTGNRYISVVYPYQKVDAADQSGIKDVITRFKPKSECAKLKSNPIAAKYNPYSCEITQYRARGTIKVGIVYLVPEKTELVKQDKKTSVDYFENPNGIFETCARGENSECASDGSTNKRLSFYYTPQYYRDQAKKYGVKDFNLIFTSYGTYKVKDVPHYGYERDMNNLETIFNKAVGSDAAKIKANSDITAYVYIDTERDKFQKDAYVSTIYNNNLYVDFNPPNADYASTTKYFDLSVYTSNITGAFTHELGHIFGASDKYVQIDHSLGTSCKKEGLGNPDQSPLFPQTTTDLYCGSSFASEEDFNKTSGGSIVQFDYNNISADRIVINKNTAVELGWK